MGIDQDPNEELKMKVKGWVKLVQNYSIMVVGCWRLNSAAEGSRWQIHSKRLALLTPSLGSLQSFVRIPDWTSRLDMQCCGTHQWGQSATWALDKDRYYSSWRAWQWTWVCVEQCQLHAYLMHRSTLLIIMCQSCTYAYCTFSSTMFIYVHDFFCHINPPFCHLALLSPKCKLSSIYLLVLLIGDMAMTVDRELTSTLAICFATASCVPFPLAPVTPSPTMAL